MKEITRDELLALKEYLESIAYINYIAKNELRDNWQEVYNIVYHRLNNHLPISQQKG